MLWSNGVWTEIICQNMKDILYDDHNYEIAIIVTLLHIENIYVVLYWNINTAFSCHYTLLLSVIKFTV